MAKKPASSAVAAPIQFFFGFKDKNGNTSIPATFEQVSEFEGDFARVKKNGKWGIISRDGQWKCEPKFDFLGKIQNGHVTFRVERSWGVADLSGRELTSARFDEIVSIGDKVFSAKKGDAYSIIDFSGKEIKGGFSQLSRWSQGFAVAVQDGTGGLISESGAWLVGPQENPVYDFSEGLAAFEDGKVSGYYGLDGKVAIEAKFDAAYDFSEGLARVRVGDKFGYIDQTGKLAIKCEWDDPVAINFSGYTVAVTMFKNGYAMTARYDGDYLRDGLLDRSGKWHDKESFESNPREQSDLKSFREENPEFQKFQEGLELGAAFDKKLKAFSEKFELALEKDRPAALKVAAEIQAHKFSPEVSWLHLIVYDLNDYGMTVIPVAKGGEELSFDDQKKFYEKERLAFKSVAKLAEKGVMDPPKTQKGLKVLNEFLEKIAFQKLEWFSDVWNEASGGKFKLPAFIENDDGSALVDLKTKKHLQLDAIEAMMKA